MKTKLTIVLLLLIGMQVHGQQIRKERTNLPKMEMVEGSEIVCYGSDKVGTLRVPAPAEFLQLRNLPNARVAAPTSQFIMTYDTAMPDSARIAFQYAVDIWQSILISKVPIRVTVSWRPLSQTGALAATGIANYLRNFPGAQKYQTWYPIAIAEKILEQEINGNQADMFVAVNPSITWYYGKDGKTPSTKYDFVSTMLHELAHGLGYSASFGIIGDQGSYGKIGGEGTGSPAIYDWYVENVDAKKLTSFTNNSADLKKQFTSSGLFFNSTLVNAANKGLRAPLYAPSTYAEGSSISHLDDATYNNTINALMTFAADRGESILDPGPVTKAMLGEMGWAMVYIKHSPVNDSEDLVSPVSITATVTGDSTLATNPVELTYFVNNFNTKTVVAMTPTGKANEYRATIPASTADRTVGYFITAKDKNSKTYSAPPAEPQLNTNGPNVYIFKTGTDKTPPTIAHTPIPFLLDSQTSAILVADVVDDYSFGIDTVYVDYQINGVAQKSLPMKYIDSTDTYQLELKFAAGSLKANDVIKYRIVARDKSKAKNQGAMPTSDFYSVQVYGIRAAADTYENNFNATSNDFVGNGFTITTPTGFLNGSLNSPHPYVNGVAPTYQNNYIYQLLTPITINSSQPYIRFDEIVLVEPGETSSLFGEPEFYDYVVVEGSKDNGKTWTAFESGYDARDFGNWLTAWNKTVDANQNSTTVATPDLYRSRQINMTSSGLFKAADKVLIRFRLYADELAAGWGWSIDNLRIQLPPITAVTPLTVTENDVQLAPNPNNGRFLLNGKFTPATTKVAVSVMNALGQSVYTNQFNGEASVQKELDLSQLTPGIYFLNVQTADSQITKRLVIAK